MHAQQAADRGAEAAEQPAATVTTAAAARRGRGRVAGSGVCDAEGDVEDVAEGFGSGDPPPGFVPSSPLPPPGEVLACGPALALGSGFPEAEAEGEGESDVSGSVRTTHARIRIGRLGTGVREGERGVRPMPTNTAVGIAASAIALPAGICNLVRRDFLGAAWRDRRA